jgi:murein L,D-transpeptidase YafK
VTLDSTWDDKCAAWKRADEERVVRRRERAVERAERKKKEAEEREVRKQVRTASV